MARSLQFNASWLHQESAAAPTRSAPPPAPLPVAANAPTLAPALAPAPAAIPPAPPEEPVTAVSAEQAVVIELLQIARTVLTLEITFQPGAPPPPALSVPDGTARFDTPVVLRDGQVYGTLCCVSDDRRTPVGSRPADALRCVAVLVGKELDRHRRKTSLV